MKENVAETTEQGQIVEPLITKALKTYKTFNDEQPSVSFARTRSQNSPSTVGCKKIEGLGTFY